MVLLTAHTYIGLKGNAHEEEVSRHNRACRRLDRPCGLQAARQFLQSQKSLRYGWLKPVLTPRHTKTAICYAR